MTWGRGALLGALALVACGRAGGGGGSGALVPASSPGDCPNGVTVRIVGTNPGDVSILRLVPGGVGASCAPAAPVCVNTNPATGELDLSSDATAHPLVTFNYPPAGFPPNGAPMVLGVEFLGGFARRGATAGNLLACGRTVFTFDPTRVSRERCSVTILLDVDRSVVPITGGLAFVPQYRVFF